MKTVFEGKIITMRPEWVIRKGTGKFMSLDGFALCLKEKLKNDKEYHIIVEEISK